MYLKNQTKTPVLRPKSESEANGLTFIEQLTALARVDCDALGVPFFFRTDEKKKHIEFAKGTCSMWSCETCGARNAKRWIARIIDGCNKLPAKNWYFATITAHKNWRGKYSSLANIRKNWHKLRKRMARITDAQGEQLFYVRVWEAHKDGSFHMHVVTNAPVSTRWLKDNSAECGLGYQAKIDEVVNAGQVAGYISKYMLKSMPNSTNYPKGARRIEVSRNWVEWNAKQSDEWGFIPSFEDAKAKANMYDQNGWKLFDRILKSEQKRREKIEEKEAKRLINIARKKMLNFEPLIVRLEDKK